MPVSGKEPNMQQALAKRIVPVVVLDKAEWACPLAEALMRAGLDVMEITFRTAAAEAAIRAIASRFPAVCVGAGTLLTAEQVRRARDAGARFGVAPGMNPAILQAAREAGLAMIPGVMTPTEVEAAMERGCRILKFFPAEAAGGVKLLKALSGPYGHTGVQFIPTGGIDAKNMRDYLALPAVAAVGGSWMVEKKLIAEGKWDDVERLTREALATAAAVK
jgi:2-dehydro-3-deoxyphosphogluconate aldolase/(4S)-4-hydroxy-2-oxoglutarate aldolase